MFELSQVTRTYKIRRGLFRGVASLKAVDGVDLSMNAGETLALVGESGCGKSTLARLLLRLERPDAGRLTFEGTDLWSMDSKATAQFRRRVQLVFQDPYSSLNPRLRVGQIVGEALEIRGDLSADARRQRVLELLEQVGLQPEAARSYPHQFSGGQRQRIGIARALAAEPALIVADEPVSALDVSVQAQILNLLQDLKATQGLTYVFISHDLRVVRYMADRVAVMYLGRIVENAPVRTLYANPLHPYTKALLDAVPAVGSVRRTARALSGDVPSPISPPAGCPFHPRCPEALDRCRTERPGVRSIAQDRFVSCHLVA